MNVSDILKACTGDEGENLYNAMAKSHAESRNKPPADLTTIGTKDNPISISSIPTLLGCEKRAFFRLGTPTDLSNSKPVQKGNLSDDCIYFTLLGIDEAVQKKFFAASYNYILSESERNTIIKKSVVVAKLLKSGALGEIRLDLCQKTIYGRVSEIGEFNNILYFRGHPDIVTQRGKLLDLYDAKYSSKGATQLGIAYYLQLFYYAVALKQDTGLLVGKTGILSAQRAEIGAGKKPTEAHMIAYVDRVKDFSEILYNKIIKLRDAATRFNHLFSSSVDKTEAYNVFDITVGDDCLLCKKCFPKIETKHENEVQPLSNKQTEKFLNKLFEPEDKSQIPSGGSILSSIEPIIKDTVVRPGPEREVNRTFVDMRDGGTKHEVSEIVGEPPVTQETKKRTSPLDAIMKKAKPVVMPAVNTRGPVVTKADKKQSDAAKQKEITDNAIKEAEAFIENTILPKIQDKGRKVAENGEPLDVPHVEW